MAHMLDNIGADHVHFKVDEIALPHQQIVEIPIQGKRLPVSVLAYSCVEVPAK